MENNMKQKTKKILLNLLLYIGFIAMTLGYVFIQGLGDMDEVWVYNFVRCIANGLLPYKEISMIMTPLFAYICAIFMKIFGNELIVFRAVECLEIGTILFVTYKIMERLKIHKGLSIILTARNICYICKSWGI